jgi:hypothetical protein
LTNFGQRFEQGFVKALRQTRDLFSRLKTMAVKLSFHCQNKSFYSQYDFNGVHGGRRLGLREPAFGGTVQYYSCATVP